MGRLLSKLSEEFVKRDCINIIVMILYRQLIGDINYLSTKKFKINC